MAQQIQLRGGTAAQWTSANPVLAARELGVETDTNLYKIGNGATAWNSLGYRELSFTSEIITLNGQTSDPSAAVAGTNKLYTKSVGGRQLPKFIGPSGLDSCLQPALFGNGVQMYSPGTGTAALAFGGPALTAVGTVSHPTLVSTNQRTQTSRFNIISAATSNSAAELRSAFARIWRGDQPGLGGFFHRSRFSIASSTLLQRSFFGFTSATTAIATTQEPNLLTNMFGVGNGLSETQLSFYSNDGTGLATSVALGAGFPANDSSAVYDFSCFHRPNGTSMTWEVKNLTTGAVATGTVADADLPISTTFLAYHAYMNNGGTAAAVNFDIMRIYTETDY